MIEVLTMKHNQATRSGDLALVSGGIGLSGSLHCPANGTLTFTHIQPDKVTRWKAAEVNGNFGSDSVRVRLSNGVKQYYFDDSLNIVEVTDVTTWDTEYSNPHLLGNIDLWTHTSLQLVVHLVRTSSDRNPVVDLARVLVDHPTWPGAIAQAVKDVVTFVGTVSPVLIHSETLAKPRREWKIGNPHSEHNYELNEIVMVTIDEVEKSATLSDGTVTLEGPEAPAGSTIEIAVKYSPNTSVRRVSEVRVVHRTPAWWIQDLVVAGGLNGIAVIVMVAGVEVQERRSELRVTINGIAHRQADALAMRAALNQAFGSGITITFPSGRCVFGQLDGLIEVVPQSSTNLPMASGILVMSISEYVFGKVAVKPRTDDGDPIFTELTIDLGDGLSITIQSS